MPVPLALPGRVNVGNAAHAAAAAELLGVAPAEAFAAMASVQAVQGRYSEAVLAPGRRGRLLLAKNPAGWVEMLELLDSEPDASGHHRLQQPHRRRSRSVLALGRAVRAAARPPGPGDRRAPRGRRRPARLRRRRAQALPDRRGRCG